ncbi:peptidoglycan DD-metalloendopeptidase family protein [Bartonella sp. HY329]|uniref:murein hydrolase activator EnvC family protein n=1 Tax=unclassified Bartonella TaxID=2645622 RepID=UPI0021C7B2DC|nr:MULTISPECIES: peptidoglycan DD-metalloendopeptidase family protein [unclassified Bartonella]UXM94863.1 peptidoglycan DD-metalloendopeptidase family protein [Bartonella sp. HY329]UXN09186.1 peptidoglycan DD-metalloendopeptidase family protein [Bartonella sp. HY328]
MIKFLLRLDIDLHLYRLPLLAAGLRAVIGFIFILLSLSISFAQADNPNDGRALANKALEDIERNMTLSKERAEELSKEVDGLKKDQNTLTQALVESATVERSLAEAIQKSETRLAGLLDEKQLVEKNLAKRRAEFSEVLAAIERLGLKPPPAILVHPDDALKAVRSAALLGAVVPDMRERMKALNVTLRQLEVVENSVKQETLELEKSVYAQSQEKKRLELLLAEKAKLQRKSEDDLTSEHLHMTELAQKAQSVQDLVAELERQSKFQLGAGTNEQYGQTPMLEVRSDFSKLKGRLALPVLGKKVSSFSKSSQGETYESDAGAVVLSPAEGIVRYAGSFRSYGQMLIIDVGQNYHIIIAGLEKLDVAPGQVVLQGEPVGSMARQLIASASELDIGKSAPMLYIEIRREGKPVDPESWWVRGQAGKGQG